MTTRMATREQIRLALRATARKDGWPDPERAMAWLKGQQLNYWPTTFFRETQAYCAVVKERQLGRVDLLRQAALVCLVLFVLVCLALTIVSCL